MTALPRTIPLATLMLAMSVSAVATSPRTTVAQDATAQDTSASQSAAQPRSLRGGEVTTLFDGASLEGWRGREDLWSVEEGAIVGRTSADKPLTSNTFLILETPVQGDFELTLQYKIEGGNSGIQYHSRVVDEDQFIVAGYQADIDAANNYAGILYEERGRGILALRGQKVVIAEDGSKQEESFADSSALAKGIHPGEWNDYRIVVRGNEREHYINETMTAKVTDQQTDKASDGGVIALQLHVGPAMTVQFKNISIRQWK